MLFARDTDDHVNQYEAVSIIEYQGSIKSTGQSDGHYICDIKDRLSEKWFRTNDNNDPKPIKLQEVSKNAYVILYKKQMTD